MTKKQESNLFDYSIQQKIIRLERWVAVLEKKVQVAKQEIYILREVTKNTVPKPAKSQKIEQLNFFTGVHMANP